MTIYGIIAEYNPFHKGHAHQITQTKKNDNDLLIVVMSGSFVQRGEISLWDKWTRASWAVQAGADLVIELPTACVLQSADYFAHAGVCILNQLGCEILSFGSEIMDKDKMLAFACEKNNLVFPNLQTELSKGKSYPQSFYDSSNQSVFLSAPNATLGIAYIHAMQTIAPQMDFVMIPRKGAHYHSASLNEEYSSASGIRQQKENPAILEKLPDFMQIDFAQYSTASLDVLHEFILYALRTATPQDLQAMQGVSEGIEHLLIQASSCTTYEQFFSQIKSKRYTQLRLQRMLCSILLKIPAQKTKSQFLFPLHVLSFNQKARTILKKARKNHQPLWSSRKEFMNLDTPLQQMAQLDLRATDIQALCFPNPAQRVGKQDFTHSLSFYERLG